MLKEGADHSSILAVSLHPGVFHFHVDVKISESCMTAMNGKLTLARYDCVCKSYARSDDYSLHCWKMLHVRHLTQAS